MSPNMRAAGLYAGLLVLALGAAWVTWTAEDEVDLDGKVVLLQGDEDTLETISWKTENDEAFIERRTDAHGDYLWVTYTRYDLVEGGHDDEDGHEHDGPDEPAPSEGEEAGPPTPEAAAAEGEAAEGEDAEGEDADGETSEEPVAEPEPEPEPERVATVTEFKAGDKGQELLASLSPLLALRKLDGIPEDKREAIGLDGATDSLVVVRKGRTATLTLGGEVYGTRDRYVRHEESGDVYLVDDEVLRPLKYARTRLPDRSLFSFERKKVASGVIASAAGESTELVQRNAADASAAAFRRAASPDAPDEQLETWMDKALKLKGSTYASSTEPPEGLEPRFSLTLTAEDGTTETLEVLQQGEDGDWYGRSEHTRGLIKMLSGPTSTLSDDIDSIIESVPGGSDEPETAEDEG